MGKIIKYWKEALLFLGISVVYIVCVAPEAVWVFLDCDLFFMDRVIANVALSSGQFTVVGYDGWTIKYSKCGLMKIPKFEEVKTN